MSLSAAPPPLSAETLSDDGQCFLLLVEHDPILSVVTIDGELDIAATPQLDRAVNAVLERAPEQLLIDLSGLSFIDSTGIHALERAHDACERRGCRLVLLRGSATVQRVLQIAGLLDAFTFVG